MSRRMIGAEGDWLLGGHRDEHDWDEFCDTAPPCIPVRYHTDYSRCHNDPAQCQRWHTVAPLPPKDETGQKWPNGTEWVTRDGDIIYSPKHEGVAYGGQNGAGTVLEPKEIAEVFAAPYDPAPSHYQGGVEPWEVVDAWGLDYYLGTLVKYIARCGKKDGESRLKDLIKARNFLAKAIELEEQRHE